MPAGTRIEKTEAIFQEVEDKIREVIPDEERDLIVDNIGLPARSYNYAFGDGTATGVNDGVILVALKEDHKPTATYIKKLRQVLPAEFPQNIFYFQAADMVTQILNFGIPSQINVRTVGYNRANNLRIAKEMQQKIAAIPGVADVHLQQEINAPEFFAADRPRPRQPVRPHGERYRAQPEHQPRSSVQVSPNFWTDPANGTPYYLAVQTPEYRDRLDQRPEEHAGDQVHGRQQQSGAGAAQQRRHAEARLDRDQRQPGQRAAAVRDLRQCRRPRPRLDLHRHQQDRGGVQAAADARQPDRGDRPDREHELRVPGPRPSASCSRRCSSIC